MEPYRDCSMLLSQLNTGHKCDNITHNWTYYAKLIHDNENHQRFLQEKNPLPSREWTLSTTRNGCTIAQWIHLFLHTKNSDLAKEFQSYMLLKFRTVLIWKWDAWNVSHSLIKEWVDSGFLENYPTQWKETIMTLCDRKCLTDSFRRQCQVLGS